MSKVALPVWAEEMRKIFRSGTVSQFILHGSIFDIVPYAASDGGVEFLGLKKFIEDVMFQPFDVVIRYDRGTGIRAVKGLEELNRFLKSYDDWNKTNFARSPASIPREPGVALGVLDRFIDWCVQKRVIEGNQLVRKPVRLAVVIDYVHFLAPRGGSLQVSNHYSEAVIRFQEWASNPAIVEAGAATVLLTQNLADLHPTVTENPYAAKIHLALPTIGELETFMQQLLDKEPALKKQLELGADVIAQRSLGLSRVNLRNALQFAARNDISIDGEYLVKKRRELIEKECNGLLDFIESPYTLDNIAGHEQAVSWLREDAQLLRAGKIRSIPMGYLMCGRIGTGKTFITTCWAGEVGIPCVVFKNFRDKWQGSTEGNLEKIFEILRALGQVMVFVDEADQATGKRDSGGTDSGLSGRIYAMLAKEMSDTLNRGKIIWVFATSRPDLLEVDLKRPGRLDVHIPLFPPQTAKDRKALFRVMTKKIGITPRTLPDLPDHMEDIGGNEMEAMLVRASRIYDLQGDKKKGRRSLSRILEDVIVEFRPMSHKAKLEFMDLVAVKECTDVRFLPERYRSLTEEDVDNRLADLRMRLS